MSVTVRDTLLLNFFRQDEAIKARLFKKEHTNSTR